MTFADNCIRVCVDQADDDRFTGTLYGVALQQPIPFCNRMDFVVKVDKAFDRIGKPQSGQVIRSFTGNGAAGSSYCGSPKHYHTSESLVDKSGSAGTFGLTMLTRRRAEWQGRLTDGQGRLLGFFETAMECVTLITRATNAKKEAER